jgi:hypothetical protein
MINCLNKGGTIDTRPGFKTMFRLPDGKAQGMTSFTASDGIPSLLIAVSGSIYISKFPFESYSKLENISFDPYVDHVVFKEAVQSRTYYH